ncbi:ROK family transcriptional regulator [Salipiger aestuarii]|uniref:ROK family transcriptional regulator n=1 Tax=Salipiger aestuarii TaxID=568098 RepID=UPI00025B78BE|nr:ROK family transcriptional regulator [Salipiger aestuarii]EIE52383.1 putative transcription regulator protein [Citreicella sp. 357]
MAGPVVLRRMNEARALECLASTGAMSRADLARALNMTRSTSSSIVATLLDEGRVQEIEEQAGRRENRTGRPSIRLRLNPDHAHYLGADIGASFLRLSAVDYMGRSRYLREERVHDRPADPETVVARIGEMVEDYLATLKDPGIVVGVNVAVPGIVDLAGNILRAPPIGWAGVPFRNMLQARLGSLPVRRLVNDANAFALSARALQRQDDALGDAVFLLLDDGIGGCIMTGGRILEGSSGIAGEIGHMPIGDTGFCNVPPVDGSLESYVARPAVLARYRALGGVAEHLSDYLDALDTGEPVARQVLMDWSWYLARGLAIVTTLLNPETVVIGGRVSTLFARGADHVTDALSRNLLEQTPVPRLILSGVGPEGVALGAAMLLHEMDFAEDSPP